MATTLKHNYLPKQYQTNNQLPINHNYLPQQFSDSGAIIDEIKELVKRGDFTLGQAVDDFEDEFKKITQTKFAIGVGSGTDAIFLSLKAAGIDKLSFGPDYIIPKPMDPRLCQRVARAVAEAAVESGVAKIPLPDNYMRD